MKKRLDLKCVELGLFDSREKAKRHIMAGEVSVNGRIVCDSSYSVKDGENIEVIQKIPYVSRGGLKLKAAIDYFKINLTDKICLDVGVATGGFSDCMLAEGAKKVYGVDVGKGQIDGKLLKNERFVFIPNTNARYLTPDIFPEKIDFAAVDVSFISLKLIIPSLLKSISDTAEVVFLVKPQFELEPGDLKNGIVKTEELRLKALLEIKNFIKNFSVQIIGNIDCPIKGIKGNKEFLLYVKKTSK